VWRSLFSPSGNWLAVFINCAYLASVLLTGFTLASALLFIRRHRSR
jgi:hypothetical protein